MTYPNHCYSVIQSRFLAYLLMAALCSGCAQVQHINGSWTGKVEAVTARDRFGSEYRIAALRLESGPEWTAANVEYDGSGAIIERINPVVGGGQLPLDGD